MNRERHHCGGVYFADERYSLRKLLASQQYQNKHPKVPRDFAILPVNILVHHVEETLEQVQKLSREIHSTEKRIAEGDIKLEDNGDYKLLNRLTNEHIRLQRRSNFEIELAANLLKYMDEYHRMWMTLWEGGTSYVDDMREKIDQQMRYSEQVRTDLEVIPRRIKNQSKAVRVHISLLPFIHHRRIRGELTGQHRSSTTSCYGTTNSTSSLQKATKRSPRSHVVTTY